MIMKYVSVLGYIQNRRSSYAPHMQFSRLGYWPGDRILKVLVLNTKVLVLMPKVSVLVLRLGRPIVFLGS